MNFLSLGQTENYIIKKASFSSDKFDEFSPVFYKKGLVFCSDRSSGLSGYSTNSNKGFFKISYIDTAGNPQWQQTKSLPGEINSHFNNGPATFSPSGDTIYFSRNLIISGSYKDITGPGNKLGLFSAVFRNGEWTDVKDLRFNDNSYNVTTPFLAPDGKRLYFASDKPEGRGGSDLYYSNWKNGYWDNPVNLGPVINTGGNEAYPFINNWGELFFSSDSLPGRGGKDIFYSKLTETGWTKPVSLKAPINSKDDDFGFIADNTNSKGYFSSNRNKGLNIYSFRTLYPQFFYCSPQKESAYCISLSDDASIDIDPLALQYSWDFGDRSIISGYSAMHCYTGPGKYSISENIVEKKGGRIVFNKLALEIEITNTGFPLIVTNDSIVAGNPLTFKAQNAGSAEITSYFWEIGDFHEKGPEVVYTFREAGEYPVRLLVNMKDKSSGKPRQYCVSRTIKLNGKEKSSAMNVPESVLYRKPEEISSTSDVTINKLYSASESMAKKAVFQVVIASSRDRIPASDKKFDNIVPQYMLKTVYLQGEDFYNYVIDEQSDFMAAYPALKDAFSRGYKNARIVTFIPDDAGEKDLWDFRRTYGSSSDIFFINNGTVISPRGMPVLDQLVLILKRNPEMKLLIAAHSANTPVMVNSLITTRKQASAIADYLAEKGIEKNRLITAGYGSARPVGPDYPESERKKNNRVEIIRIN